ncbi:unnamed protein product [Phytophthora fragariaefolia]|uniref:Unnamed protein product n=1 Tax=Phytophthora fragariaefolia TaxID=1490495 RepID=A0A9W7CM49_9STRA|nr:unnamed protein product [Phytophthora fragariaefolia]
MKGTGSVKTLPADVPSRSPRAGVTEASEPSSPPTASIGDVGGVASEPLLASDGAVLSSTLGAVPRSTADAPEGASSVSSVDSQPQGSVSSSGTPLVGTCAAADEPEASSAVLGADRFSSGRWEAIENIVTTGTDRTVQQVQGSSQSYLLALARLIVDLNRRPPLRINYESDRHLEAAESLSYVVDALSPVSRSPAPWEDEMSELQDDVASLEARLAASEASLCREVVIKAERLCNKALHVPNAALENLRRLRQDHADAALQLMPTNIALEPSSRATAALEQRCRRLDKSLADTHNQGWFRNAHSLRNLLEELRALQLAIPPPPAASESSEASAQTVSFSSAPSGGASDVSGSLTALAIYSSSSVTSGPIIPSALHKSKGKRLAKPSAKPRSSPSSPKTKRWLGRVSVDLKAWKTAPQTTSTAADRSESSQSVPPPPPATSASASLAPVSGITVSVGSNIVSFASVPNGSTPPFSPFPRQPASPASSTASTTFLRSTPMASSGPTPGTETSLPVKIDDEGDLGMIGLHLGLRVPLVECLRRRWLCVALKEAGCPNSDFVIYRYRLELVRLHRIFYGMVCDSPGEKKD